ncbi:hypothetical protein KW807_01925, partial [Candidatus Parcubacteria bacterium]|nr:hypothetical protein [Candidatus Parcubacteria bacterium]
MTEFIPKHKVLTRTSAIYIMAAVFFMSVPVSYAATSADIKANGSDGPVTITIGESFTYSWNSVDATACQLTSPTGDSGIATSGTGGPIDPTHPWYPTIGNPTTLTLNCTDGANSTSDSVVINVAAPAAVTVDIKANGSDGPVTINNGDSFTYSWSSTSATACQLTSPTGDSGIATSGTGGPIDPTHPWYPTATSSTTLTLNCTDGLSSASDSVVIGLAVAPPPPSQVTADIKANGSDGPVTVAGEPWNYSWTSTGATACEL